MIRNDPKSQQQRPWRLLLGLLCLALVVLGSTVQVAHSHADGDVSHADCSLCATAHVVAQAVASPGVVAAVLVVASVYVAPRPPRIARPSLFALFTRPPPAVSTFA